MKSRLKRHPRLYIQFPPMRSSCLNVIERSIRDLTQERIRNEVFRSVAELDVAIRGDIEHHNANPSWFVWMTWAEDILASVARARASLNQISSV